MQRKTTLLIALLVGLPLLGAALGYILRAQPSERGFSLGTPPERAEKIVAANTFYVIVQTTSGKYLQCNFAPDDLDVNTNCWQPTDSPTTNLTNLTNSADAPRIDGSRFAPPPSPTRDYWVATFFDNIGGLITETRYALLDDGRVWAWTYQTSMFTNVSPTVDGMLGAVFGLCCLGALSLVLWAILAATIWRKPLISSNPFFR